MLTSQLETWVHKIYLNASIIQNWLRLELSSFNYNSFDCPRLSVESPVQTPERAVKERCGSDRLLPRRLHLSKRAIISPVSQHTHCVSHSLNTLMNQPSSLVHPVLKTYFKALLFYLLYRFGPTHNYSFLNQCNRLTSWLLNFHYIFSSTFFTWQANNIP